MQYQPSPSYLYEKLLLWSKQITVNYEWRHFQSYVTQSYKEIEKSQTELLLTVLFGPQKLYLDLLVNLIIQKMRQSDFNFKDKVGTVIFLAKLIYLTLFVAILEMLTPSSK